MTSQKKQDLTESLYREYLSHLLKGNRQVCHDIVNGLIESSVNIRDLYVNLFQRSLYEIGTLWEYNNISVAVEHLATSITEGLMSLTYPVIFSADKIGKSAIVSCIANEHHQIGGRMVADIFELHGWDGYFLGANTPSEALLRMIDEKKPNIVGLSLSVYFNIGRLTDTVEMLRATYPELPIIVGGQAFLHITDGSLGLFRHRDVIYIDLLHSLEKQIIGVKWAQ